LDLLIGRERRPSGKDVWRYETPDIALPKEQEALVALGWTEDMDSRQTVGFRATARADAFRTLPAEEQEHWNEKAHSYKPPAPTK